LVSIHSKYGVQRETEKPAGKPFDPQTAIFDPAKLISGSGPLPSFAPRPAPFELATAVFDPAKPSLGETQKAEAANTPFKSDLTQAVESSYPEKKEISIDESTRSSAKKVLTFQTAPAFSVAASEMNVDETPRPAISARLDFSSKIAEETPKPNFQFSMTKIEDSGFSFSFKPPAATAAVVEKSANKNQTPSFSLGTPAEAAPPSSFGFDSVASAKKSPEISQGSPEQHLAAKQSKSQIILF
jgi:hypothetical protein